MHGQMHPSHCQITTLYFVGSWPLFIIGLLYDDPIPSHSWKLPIKFLVARQLPTNVHTYMYTLILIYTYLASHAYLLRYYVNGTQVSHSFTSSYARINTHYTTITPHTCNSTHSACQSHIAGCKPSRASIDEVAFTRDLNYIACPLNRK